MNYLAKELIMKWMSTFLVFALVSSISASELSKLPVFDVKQECTKAFPNDNQKQQNASCQSQEYEYQNRTASIWPYLSEAGKAECASHEVDHAPSNNMILYSCISEQYRAEAGEGNAEPGSPDWNLAQRERATGH